MPSSFCPWTVYSCYVRVCLADPTWVGVDWIQPLLCICCFIKVFSSHKTCNSLHSSSCFFLIFFISRLIFLIISTGSKCYSLDASFKAILLIMFIMVTIRALLVLPRLHGGFLHVGLKVHKIYSPCSTGHIFPLLRHISLLLCHSGHLFSRLRVKNTLILIWMFS